ncbi:MAG: hypothetical protein II922_12040 [Succinimonas sp.]|nr:hypothetical protein [Succinimonas sp.]
MSVKKSFHCGYLCFLFRGGSVSGPFRLLRVRRELFLLHVAEEVSFGYRRHVHDFSMSVKKSFHRGYLFFLDSGLWCFSAPQVTAFSGGESLRLLHVAEEVSSGYRRHVHDFCLSVKKSFHFVILRNLFGSSR